MRLFALVFSILFVFVAFGGMAQAGDIRGSRDHPMIKRFPGARIVAYGVKRFDEYKLLTNKIALIAGVS